MYSTVPLLARVSDEPLTIDGLTIPANSVIELNIDGINHRPDVWPDHEVTNCFVNSFLHTVSWSCRVQCVIIPKFNKYF